MNTHAPKNPAKRKIRYAVVGAGWIAQEDFMPGVAHTGNSELSALVTGSSRKAKELCKLYSIPHACDYAAYDAILRSGKIDAVYIALPNSMHRSYAVRALDAGIHVLCEKPMAPTEDDCLVMIAASERSGAKLMIAYRLHFEAATIDAIELARSGDLGDLRIFSSVHVQQSAPVNHRLKAEFWAGPLPDMGPYPINAVRQLFEAEPTEVLAFSTHGRDPRFREVPEMVSAQLVFPGDRLAQFVVSFGANAFSQYRLVGTRGDLEVTPAYTWTDGLKHLVRFGETKGEKTYDKVDQFGGETRYFSQCILDGRHPEPDGEEGLADVRVIKAIERSCETGRPEKVEPSLRSYRPTRDQKETLSAVKAGKLIDATPAG